MPHFYFDIVYNTAPRVTLDDGMHHPKLVVGLDLGLITGQIYSTDFDRNRALIVSHPLANLVFVEYNDKLALHTTSDLSMLLGSLMTDDDVKRLLGYDLRRAEVCKALQRIIQQTRLYDMVGNLLDTSARGRITVRHSAPLKLLETAT